jgi:hypothetical protein
MTMQFGSFTSGRRCIFNISGAKEGEFGLAGSGGLFPKQNPHFRAIFYQRVGPVTSDRMDMIAVIGEPLRSFGEQFPIRWCGVAASGSLSAEAGEVKTWFASTR